MFRHFADRLLAAVAEKGAPVCVGLDPVLDRLPADIVDRAQTLVDARSPDSDPQLAAAAAITLFCKRVIRAVAPAVPAVKPQIACFERYGPSGLGAYHSVVADARAAGLIVIGDAKRGDIGATADHYAAAHLADDDAPDALTVNGYFGADGLAPFVRAARNTGRGLFVLVRTSNPSAAQVQDFADADGRKVFEHVADCVAQVGAGQGLLGKSGFSCVGAVVGATYPDEARRLREIMPRQLFLVPGYGAQGATADDAVAGADSAGRGILVNASRSVLYAFDRDDRAADWTDAIAAAAANVARDVRAALGG